MWFAVATAFSDQIPSLPLAAAAMIVYCGTSFKHSNFKLRLFKEQKIEIKHAKICKQALYTWDGYCGRYNTKSVYLILLV